MAALESEHQRQKSRADLILNSAGTGVCVLDKNAKSLFMNTAACEITGWENQDSLGQSLHCLIQRQNCQIADANQRCVYCPNNDEDNHETHYCDLYDTFVDGKKHIKHDTFWRKDGLPVPVRYVSTPIIENNELTGVFIIFENISHRLQSEQALKDSEALKQAMLESSLDAIVTINQEGLIYEFNKNAEALFGYKKSDIFLKPMADLIIPPQYRAMHLIGMHNYLHAGIDNILRKRIEINAMHASGAEFPVELVVAPININNSVWFTAFISDITERNKAKIAIENARIEAERANRAKSQFLAAMSHEIRTPLNAMMGVNDLLSTTQVSNEQAEYLKIAHQAGQSLQEVVNNILDFSKIEAGKIELELQETDLLSIIDSVLTIMGPKATEKQIDLFASIDYPIPERALIDLARLRQILLNLVSNAIKFTEAGYVEIKLGGTINAKGDYHLLFSVTDTGIGISPSVKKLIFEEFSQADLSTTRKYGGTGLGLAIASRLISMFGGEIGVDSQEGQGSTFWFSFDPLDKRVSTPKSFNSANCFVIHSQKKSIVALYKQLQAVCSNVQLIQSFDEVEHFDSLCLVFVDEHQLPYFSMKEIQSIKASQKLNIVKVLITDVGHRPNHEAWLEYFDKQLVKPIQFNQLNALIKNCVDALQNGQKNPPTDVSVSPPTDDSPKTGHRILLVEDSLANQFVIRAMLEKANHTIDIASNGAIAVETSQKQAYDMILMDLSMPVMGGLEAAEQIRQNPGPNQHTPIIALTASAFEDKKKLCLQIGMNSFLTKPLNMIVLQEEITKYLQINPENPDRNTPEAVMQLGLDEDVIDYSVLQQLKAETSEAIFPQLLNIFLEQGAARSEVIEQAIDQHDFAKLSSEIHAFKSESATFGAIKLGELTEHINLLCKHSEIEHAFAQAKAVKENWLVVKDELQNYIARKP
ncbi:hypothetical protein JCM14076_29100 [Methylosoma difficile]